MSPMERKERRELVQEQIEIAVGLMVHPHLKRLQREWAKTRSTAQLVEAVAAMRALRDLMDRKVTLRELSEALERFSTRGVPR